jgi:molecular chaperone DnaJ
MKYSGHGDSSYKDLPPGDLYIQFRVHETPDFIVEGLDVVKNIRISFLDALVGRKIKVRGLDGKEFEITIPPGLQYGSRLRIAQQGLWALNQPIRGNFIVQVELRVPTDFTAEQFKMLEQIAEEHRSNTGNES